MLGQQALGLKALVVVLAGALSAGGCASKAQTGAVAGGVGGAALGAGIGSFSHARAGEGALIGGALGALGGALIGNEMDKQDEARWSRENQSIREARQSTVAAYQPVTRQDVAVWTQRGVRDEIIIDRIQRSGTVFHMTAADENWLRDEGVSEEVIYAMKNTARQ